MAEIVVTAVVTALFEKLFSADLMKLARSEGIDSQLEIWRETLDLVEAVLADAGQKQRSNTAVESWLHKLHDLTYDIDDVLDDLATEAMRRKLNQESYASSSTGKVLKMIPTCCINFTPHNINYDRRMSSKLDEITTRLRALFQMKNDLGLNANVDQSKIMGRANRRLEQTSLVDESKIMGRERDKEALLGKLLGNNESCNENVSIVSIVGMGGVGKTTLAKLLYNEEKVKHHFELRAWVCVAEDFDVLSISKAIFQAVTGEDKNFASLDLLHVALKEKLSNKRFLLVLDDLWNEGCGEWQLLQSPFLAAASGSKVIVTTRKKKVASVMDSEAYDLDVLSDEEALLLFAQHSVGENNFDKHPTLKEHAEGIVKKCGRLPLALITLGRVLKTKRSEDEWEELLNSEIWNLQDEKEILPALRLSYYDLPSHLKLLFVYCSLFPKDYVFEKNELVLLWMAEGFLRHSNGNKSMESLGREYFEELKSRSFFQDSTNEESRYIMHDLINDLAISVAGEFFFMLDDKMDADDRNEAFEKFRHFSFVGREEVYRKFKELRRARPLRTFLPVWKYIWHSMSLNKDFVELLPHLQFVRVLSLARCSITEVPRSISSLKHIRYLNFSRTSITCIPEQVSDLYNLQSLLVSGCWKLYCLPASLVKLKNLRHLDIKDTPSLNKIPIGIGGSTSLQTLSKAIIEGGNGFKISELKDLMDLQGSISIEGLHNVTNAREAKDANLQQKKGLDRLVLRWHNAFDDSRNGTAEYEVLTELRPHQKLRYLNISFYGGMEFPCWVGYPSFDQLTELRLRNCRSCTQLPTLGHLPSLRELYVSGMDKVKTVGSEFLAPANCFHDVIAFPSLEILEFYDMQSWEIWSTSGGHKDGTAGLIFPRLRQFSISYCPKLAQVAIGDLNIGGFSLESYYCPNSVEAMVVSDCDSMTSLTFSTVQELPSSLNNLYIMNCGNLRSIHGGCLVHLTFLTIGYCDNIESIPEHVFDFPSMS